MRGGAGAPPGGQQEPPARSWLTEAVTLRTATKSAARRRKENAAMARREAPRISERKCGHTKNNGCAPWRAIPLIFEGRQREDGPTRGLAKQYG